MIFVELFCEDVGQTSLVEALILRAARMEKVEARVVTLNATGGAGTVLTSIRTYRNDLKKSRRYVDLLVIAIDANSYGVAARRKQVHQLVGDLAGPVVVAIPDPYIEAWYLADPSAVSRLYDSDVEAPTPKQRKRADYKIALLDAFRLHDVEPPLGGTEYGAELGETVRLDIAVERSSSFGAFWHDLRQAIRLAAQVAD